MWRHGDVLIAQVDAIPASATVTTRSILVCGEMTGHAHRLETPANATIYTDVGNTTGMGVLYLLVMSTVQIIHEEHHPISLQPGTYRVWQQREYTPQAIRNIYD